MIFNVIGLIIGVMILAAGLFYLIKEKKDVESRKIYSIVSVAGAVIVVFILLRICL